ncbi:MAG: PQQ-dependent sugar dehydrogenase [Alphaproteobacteria bacterium]|nr:PQQ-dependent sugar dehydrogenase [Alphaproteobacteria bacterium]
MFLSRLSLVATGILACASFAQAQDRPGDIFEVRAQNLPAPFVTQSVGNSSETVARNGHVPIAPDGYTVTLFAADMDGARNLVVDDDGTVIVARSRAGVVTLLRDRNGDGTAEQRDEIAKGFNRPHGLALQGGYLWIADLDRLYRLRWGDKPGRLEAMSPSGVFGESGGHWTRNIAFSPDGQTLYASIGSRGNIAEEPAPRATIQRFSVVSDGMISTGETFASGLRNPVGIAIKPGTDQLYTVVNERDGLGDGLVPDYFTQVQKGDFYGWPYAYTGQNPQPDFANRRPDLVIQSKLPDVLFESHSAPIGLTFLAGADVPSEWRDDGLVALRGSWNAAVPTGYKVVRVEFQDGHPTGRYINFLTGFRVDTPDPNYPSSAQVWGRPVGVAVGPDGAIYVTDDTGGTVWRISK